MSPCMMIGNNKIKPHIIIKKQEYIQGGEGISELITSKRYRVIVSVWSKSSINSLKEYGEAYIENNVMDNIVYNTDNSLRYIKFEIIDTEAGFTVFFPFGIETTAQYTDYNVSINIFEV